MKPGSTRTKIATTTKGTMRGAQTTSTGYQAKNGDGHYTACGEAPISA